MKNSRHLLLLNLISLILIGCDSNTTTTTIKNSPQTSTVKTPPSLLLIDAEDGKTTGWKSEKASSQMKLSNIYDTKRKSRVIQFNTPTIYDAYRYRIPSNIKKDYSIIQWSSKFTTQLYAFKIFVNTEQGDRILSYVAKDTGNGKKGRTITHGLGSDADNGAWHTYTRDLNIDLMRYEKGNHVLAVQGFLFYGSGEIDDIQLYHSPLNLNIQKPRTILAPGIVLTFDDSLIEDWYAMRETFIDKGVVATFFCNGWNKLSTDAINKFKNFRDDGSEIAIHTKNHLSTYDTHYQNMENKAQVYLEEQVLPTLSNMRKEDFEPTSFSYPYMSSQPQHNALIRSYLPHIRSFFSSVYQIDNVAKHSIADIKKELLRLKENQDVGVFLAHRILPLANANTYAYRVPTETLVALIDEANRLGLKFYTLEEAHRIYTQE